MRKMTITLLTAAVCLAGHPTTADAREALDPGRRDAARMAASNNAFALKLYAKLAKADGNLFFSPSSIHTALAMTYAGARANTSRQMQSTLALPTDMGPGITIPGPDGGGGGAIGFDPRPWPRARVHAAYRGLLANLKPGKDAGYKLHVANALWGQKGYPWLKEFLAATRTNYGAGLREVDFVTQMEKARKTINGWVEDQTNDKIKELLQRGILNPDTRLVLTNAIYFKGDWARQFKKAATKHAPFRLSPRKTVKVPMMNQTAEFGYAETKDLQVLRLPYKGKDLSMLVLLPRKVGDLTAAEEYLSKRLVMKRPGAAKLAERQVIISLPKFKLTAQFRLNKVLAAMGMTDAFSGAADFSGMNGRKDLYISAVIHKAFVDVNEEGTEAAAATAVVMARDSAEPPPPVFRADRAFLFLIRHQKTGAILFLGRVTNPAG